MDVRTICLAVLTRGDATGYEIKKLVEDSGYQHFVEASFGSIYPALGRLTQEGLVSLRAEAQEKRPDRKVYSLTEAGRQAVTATLMGPLGEDKHRSPFLFTMLFAHLLPQDHVLAMVDAYIRQSEDRLAQIETAQRETATPGERFVLDYGAAVYTTMIQFLRTHRAEFDTDTAEAAE